MKTLLVIHLLYSKNKKDPSQWEKSVRALMINRDIFLSGLRSNCKYKDVSAATAAFVSETGMVSVCVRSACSG